MPTVACGKSINCFNLSRMYVVSFRSVSHPFRTSLAQDVSMLSTWQSRPDYLHLREGSIVLWDDKTRQKVKRYLFLFNDLLLFTIPKKRGKKFQLVIYMTLRSPSVAVEIVDNSSYNNEFRYTFPLLSYFEDCMPVVRASFSSLNPAKIESIGLNKLKPPSREPTLRRITLRLFINKPRN